jgi:hypothetical protein
MTSPEHDEDFEQYLRQRTVLPHRLAKADRLEPPPELDRLVLAHAKEAIHVAVLLHMRENGEPSRPLAAAAPVRTLSKARELAPPPQASDSDALPRSPMGPAYARTRQESAQGFAPARNAAVAEQKAHAQRLPSAPVAGVGPTPFEARVSAHAPVAKARAPIPAPAEVASLDAASPPAVSMEAASGSALLTPADWRAKIAKLRAQGKTAEADREQAAFVKAYPDEQPLGDPSR